MWDRRILRSYDPDPDFNNHDYSIFLKDEDCTNWDVVDLVVASYHLNSLKDQMWVLPVYLLN